MEVPRGNAAILQPTSFDYISGEVEIRGNAKGDNFSNYRMAYFEGFTPSDIHVIAEGCDRAKRRRTPGDLGMSGG